MKVFILVTLMLVCLGGCLSNGSDSVAEIESNALSESSTPLWLPPKNTYRPAYTHKQLADYAQQLAMELATRLNNPHQAVRLGIASFVHFDHSLQQTDILGNQLAEYLIAELQAYGIEVVDFKTQPQLAINWSGDYVFSRDLYNLSTELELDYVLSGTVIYQASGAQVNARVVNMQNKVVAASARVHIPQFMLQQITQSMVLVN